MVIDVKLILGVEMDYSHYTPWANTVVARSPLFLSQQCC